MGGRQTKLVFVFSSQLCPLSFFPLEQAAFEALLAEPLMLAVAAAEGGEEGATATTSSLAAAVRSAALRALAGLLAASEDADFGDATRALGLFAQAALAASGPGGADTDVVTWQRLGTLVRESMREMERRREREGDASFSHLRLFLTKKRKS